MNDVPLLDDTVTCPRCLSVIPAADLCEHDDPDTGPLCLNLCCGYWHGGSEAA